MLKVKSALCTIRCSWQCIGHDQNWYSAGVDVSLPRSLLNKEKRRLKCLEQEESRKKQCLNRALETLSELKKIVNEIEANI